MRESWQQQPSSITLPQKTISQITYCCTWLRVVGYMMVMDIVMTSIVQRRSCSSSMWLSFLSLLHWVSTKRLDWITKIVWNALQAFVVYSPCLLATIILSVLIFQISVLFCHPISGHTVYGAYINYSKTQIKVEKVKHLLSASLLRCTKLLSDSLCVQQTFLYESFFNNVHCKYTILFRVSNNVRNYLIVPSSWTWNQHKHMFTWSNVYPY